MSVSRGLNREGRFDLRHYYQETGTPHWILDAQYAWHPFAERLTYSSYEVASLLVSCLTILVITWTWWGESDDDAQE